MRIGVLAFFGRMSCAVLVFAWFPPATAAPPVKRKPPMSNLVKFQNSPYPFIDGSIPANESTMSMPFFQTDTDGRRYHFAPRGGKLFETQTYNDDRSLIAVAPGFDPKRPNAFVVLFLHGNLATLSRDVAARQGVPRQLIESHANAVLVAPQLAVDALDSSPGHFYDPGFFDKYMHEAAAHVVTRAGQSVDDIERLPIVIVAYSGGYLATAFSLHYAMPPRDTRIRGVILLDALFGEEQKFEDWLVTPESRGAFFVSAYSKASAALNRQLEDALGQRGIRVATGIPKEIRPGDVIFRVAPGAVHNDFVTQAWTRDPLADLLGRIRW